METLLWYIDRMKYRPWWVQQGNGKLFLSTPPNRQTFDLDEETLPDWATEIRTLSVIFEGLHYEINPLLTREEILLEAEFMRHCVADYVEDCIKGNSSIWSMTTCEPGGVPEKTLTIEVERGKCLTEVQGFENREASAQELKVLNQWARENGFANHLE